MVLAREPVRVTPLNGLRLALIMAYFVVVGLLLIAFPFVSTLAHRDVFDDLSTAVWRLLQEVGFVLPLLAFVCGVLLLQLARRLSTRHIGAARWARSILFWLMIAGALLVGRAVLIQAPLLPWVLFVGASALVYLLINYTTFRGDEDVSQQNTRTAWNLLVPSLIIFLFLGGWALEQVFITSLTNQNFTATREADFVGLNNYAELLGIRLDSIECIHDDTGECITEERGGERVAVYPNPRGVLGENYRAYGYRPVAEFDVIGMRLIISARDQIFFEAVLTSLTFTVFAVTFQLLLGFVIASVLAAKFRGGGLLRLALLIPLAIPTLIAAQFWLVMLDDSAAGALNSVLLNFGFIEQPQAWLINPLWQLPALILVIVWKETPAMALLLLPGLVSIPAEIYEAAGVDGMNAWQRFRFITLPMMRPYIGIAVLLRTMISLRVFDIFDLLTGGTPHSMATYAQQILTVDNRLGQASAISMTIFVIILFFTIIYLRVLRLDD